LGTEVRNDPGDSPLSITVSTLPVNAQAVSSETQVFPVRGVATSTAFSIDPEVIDLAARLTCEAVGEDEPVLTRLQRLPRSYDRGL
jgi:hypothetical protein